MRQLPAIKQYLHGEAIVIGMHMEAKLSHQLGLIDNKAVARIKALIDSFELPSEMPDEIKSGDLLEKMQLDKKTVSGRMHFVLPGAVGSVKIHSDITAGDIIKLGQSPNSGPCR